MNLKKLTLLALLMLGNAALFGMEFNHQEAFVNSKIKQLELLQLLNSRQRLENALLGGKTAAEFSAYLKKDLPPVLTRLNKLDPHSCTYEEFSAVGDVVQQLFQTHPSYEQYKTITRECEVLRIELAKLSVMIDLTKVDSSALFIADDIDQAIKASVQESSKLCSAIPHLDLMEQSETWAAIVEKSTELDKAILSRTAHPAASARTNVENMGPSSSSSSSSKGKAPLRQATAESAT